MTKSSQDEMEYCKRAESVRMVGPVETGCGDVIVVVVELVCVWDVGCGVFVVGVPDVVVVVVVVVGGGIGTGIIMPL